MSRAHEKKHEEGQMTWLRAMLDLLWGGLLGMAVALLVLMLAAVLVSSGVIGNGRADRFVIAGCLLGGFLGSMYAVRRRKSAPLPTGLGVGGILFLILLTAGVLLYDSLPTISSGGVVACACLCGGGLSGVLWSKPKKKRRK